jgi:hypothetical protein
MTVFSNPAHPPATHSEITVFDTELTKPFPSLIIPCCPSLCTEVVKMTPMEREHMDRLCERIQVEKDPKVFTILVDELNELLDRTHQRIDSTKLKAS